MAFVELSATSNFTCLTGGSHPEEYLTRAADLGLAALALADENLVPEDRLSDLPVAG